jgi:hypothetical protein
MDRHAATFEEDFDGGRGEAGLEGFVDQLIGNAVKVVVDRDVIVDVGPADFPFREF